MSDHLKQANLRVIEGDPFASSVSVHTSQTRRYEFTGIVSISSSSSDELLTPGSVVEVGEMKKFPTVIAPYTPSLEEQGRYQRSIRIYSSPSRLLLDDKRSSKDHHKSPLEELMKEIEKLTICEQNLIIPSLLKIFKTVPFEDRERDKLTKELVGKSFTPKERLELEYLNLKNSIQQKKEIISDSFSLEQVCELFDASPNKIVTQVEKDSLLGFRVQESFYFPSWQFDRTQPNLLINGLAEVLKSLDIPSSSISRISWFLKPNQYLKNKNPLQALKNGQIDQVVSAAKMLGVK